jgi:hypothetical protein
MAKYKIGESIPFASLPPELRKCIRAHTNNYSDIIVHVENITFDLEPLYQIGFSACNSDIHKRRMVTCRYIDEHKGPWDDIKVDCRQEDVDLSTYNKLDLIQGGKYFGTIYLKPPHIGDKAGFDH